MSTSQLFQIKKKIKKKFIYLKKELIEFFYLHHEIYEHWTCEKGVVNYKVRSLLYF